MTRKNKVFFFEGNYFSMQNEDIGILSIIFGGTVHMDSAVFFIERKAHLG